MIQTQYYPTEVNTSPYQKEANSYSLGVKDLEIDLTEEDDRTVAINSDEELQNAAKELPSVLAKVSLSSINLNNVGNNGKIIGLRNNGAYSPVVEKENSLVRNSRNFGSRNTSNESYGNMYGYEESTNETIPRNLNVNNNAPKVPVMIEVPDFSFDSEMVELNRQCGFIILLNSRLIELQLESKIHFPKFDLTKREEKLKELFGVHYEKIIQEKAELEKVRRTYEKELNQVRPLQQLNQDLNREVIRLRESNKALTSSIRSISNADIRSMLSEQSRKYVQEIEFQLNYYRTQVITLLGEVENMRLTSNTCMGRLSQAQRDLATARDEMVALVGRVNEMEESSQADKENVARLKLELEQSKAQFESEKQAMQWQIEHLKNEKEVLSEALSNERSKQVALEYDVSSDLKYEQQIQELQEQLSILEANKIQIQDQWEKRLKDNQESADKFRAKYESVKQHVQTLELQHGEYVRVNEALKKQNNEFRQLITRLQQELRQVRMTGPMMGVPNMGMSSANLLMGQEAALNQFKTDSKSELVNGPVLNNNASQNSNGSNGKVSRSIVAEEDSQSNSNPVSQSQSQPQSQAARSVPELKAKISGEGVPDNNEPEIEADSTEVKEPKKPVENSNNSQELWSRRSKILSQSGVKKRMLVEWHFLTSDNTPHSIVLQHTQDSKAKTRRMLWVDGAEKYNNKSSASSFRIEIGNDVVVVTIELLANEYHYRLAINGLNYLEAFQMWKSYKNQK